MHSYNPNRKPYWTNNVKQKHKEAKQVRSQWISEGRPRGNLQESYRNYKTAKKNFKEAQNLALLEYENEVIEEIDKTAECDIRLFWKLLNKQRRKPKQPCLTLRYNNDNGNTPQEIADLFGEYFENLYKENFDDQITNDNIDFINNQALNSNFELSDIVKVISQLKNNKS